MLATASSPSCTDARASAMGWLSHSRRVARLTDAAAISGLAQRASCGVVAAAEAVAAALQARDAAQWGLASYTRAGHLAVPSGRWAGWWDILPVFVVGWGCL